MTLDTTQQRFGPTMNLDYQQHSQSPAFSNPWTSSSSPPQSAPSGGMFVGSQQQPPPLNPSMMAGKPQGGRTSTSSGSSMASYGSMPVTSSAGVCHTLDGTRQDWETHQPLDIMNMNRVPPTSAPYGDASYTTSASPVNGQFATSNAPYDTMGYAPAPIRPAQFGLVPETERSAKYPPTCVSTLYARMSI